MSDSPSRVGFRHLRQFVAVSEQLHFGRAAARMGIAQSPLSRSIRRLERALGLQLLERNRQHVALTSAGAVLLEEARRILVRVEQAHRRTLQVAGAHRSGLVIGFIPPAMLTLLPPVLRTFRQRWPGIHVSLEERHERQQIEALLDGYQDVGVLSRPRNPVAGLETKLVERTHSAIAISAKHPLARKGSLRLSDLKSEPFVAIDPDVNPDAYTGLQAVCRSAGFVPNIVEHATHMRTTMSLVSNGVGVALVGENARLMGLPGVSMLRLIDHPESLFQEIVLA